MFMFVKKMRKIEWNKEGLFLFTIILICIKTTYKRFAQKIILRENSQDLAVIRDVTPIEHLYYCLFT